MSTIKIINDCSLTHMPKMEEASIGSIITDPPYEIGFMGRDWDGAGVAYAPGVWRECLRVLKPGGHLLAFGGTRTYHRLATAIETEGFEIRDVISWLYSSGFPKSKNLGKGRGTQLKPAQELIVMARKPISEKTVAKNIERWGTGGINIDACRIPALNGNPSIDRRTRGLKSGKGGYTFGGGEQKVDKSMAPNPQDALGRWPANVATDRSPEVEEGMPRIKGSGDKDRGGFGKYSASSYRWQYTKGGLYKGYHDDGSAARFFYCAKASRNEREFGLGKSDQRLNAHPTVKPVALMRWLARLITPKGDLILDPFCGSGTTGIAALLEGYPFIGIEQNAEYAELAARRIKGWTIEDMEND